MRLYHGSKLGLKGAIKPESRAACDFGSGFYMGTESTQPHEHRRDGLSFMEIIERDTGEKWYDA